MLMAIGYPHRQRPKRNPTDQLPPDKLENPYWRQGNKPISRARLANSVSKMSVGDPSQAKPWGWGQSWCYPGGPAGTRIALTVGRQSINGYGRPISS